MNSERFDGVHMKKSRLQKTDAGKRRLKKISLKDLRARFDFEKSTVKIKLPEKVMSNLKKDVRKGRKIGWSFRIDVH